MVHSVPAQEGSATRGRQVLERAAPAYPELARKLNLAGTVKLRVIVSSGGTVSHCEVVGGNPVLVKAAQDAVRRWRWVAAPQETKEEVELNFHPK